MADVQLWEVVGGGDKGGIVVRTGQEVSSPAIEERLSTGALVKELSLQGERLWFKRLTGKGPDSGWVSIVLASSKELLVRRQLQKWDVVGGGDKGGIVVREGKDTSSPLCAERLETGALLGELLLQDERLHYVCLAGAGPVTGWVSLKLASGKELVLPHEEAPAALRGTAVASDAAPTLEAAPAAGHVVGGPDLDIRMRNEEKDFSYEGLPDWVPICAAIQKLWREGKPYLAGTPTELIPRLVGCPMMKPWKRFPPKQLREVSKQILPGCLFELEIPNTCQDISSPRFGAEWLTKAFHAAGTLPKDNRVAKIVLCEELPTSGFDCAGGAAMKAFITVEYEKPDPSLHTELFAKYPFEYDVRPTRQELSGIRDNDGQELAVNLYLSHLFPFRVPVFYFCDICRETTNYILITERVPFGKKDKMVNGEVVERLERKPYEVLPTCGKYQDYLLQDPAEYYCCLFRAMGRLAAWDKLGRFDGFFGPMQPYDGNAYLAGVVAQRNPLTMRIKEATKDTIAKMVDKAIEFLTDIAKNIVPAETKDLAKLQKLKAELIEMAPYFRDMSQTFQANHSDYVAAMHVNLQADNAYFWRDEYGTLDCGVLDWGGFSRSPFCMNFLGCLSGATAELLLAHEEGILRSFVDEYARCGGPKLDLEEVMLRFHLGYITFVYESIQWLELNVLKETTREEFADMKNTHDERFQGRWLTRCRSTTVVYAFNYYMKRGDFKAKFDKWSQGVGKPYLQPYV